MKIQCDMCNKHDASLFCTADEAALCDTCDHRIHHVNKLASKHQRFSLNHPSPNNHFPLCDICLERRGFIFCQQDRAILCKECDLPIHAANEHTKKHTRFLLTGIKLSPSATLYSPSQPSNSKPSDQSCAKKNPLLDSFDSEASHHMPAVPLMAKTSTASVSGSLATNEACGFITSSISEYLINTIPGWQFEDFLDSPSVPFAAFSKDGDIVGNMVSFSAESMGGIWVPQAPSSMHSAQMEQQKIGYKGTKEATNIIKARPSTGSRLGDDNFIVPQISFSNNAAKRPRLLW